MTARTIPFRERTKMKTKPTYYKLKDKYHKEFVLKLYRRTSDGEWQYYFTPGNTWNKSMGLFSASPHITTSEIPTSDLFRRVGAKEAEKFIEKLQSK